MPAQCLDFIMRELFFIKCDPNDPPFLLHDVMTAWVAWILNEWNISFVWLY